MKKDPMSRKPRLGVICGGSGSSKFVRGIARFANLDEDSFEPSFICNVADNFWHMGLYICPDIDIVLYALAGNLDRRNGWGIVGDTYNVLETYSKLSNEAPWFKLGDKDLSLSLRRTELLRRGHRLSAITESFRRSLGVPYAVIPSTDDRVETFIDTTQERHLHLQNFWVQRKGKPQISKVSYVGIRKARLHQKAQRLLSSRVLLCPANPITSIGPTIELRGARRLLEKAKKVVAISPFIGRNVISGPAVKMMKARGIEASSYGVASFYSSFLRTLFVDEKEEASIVKRIEDIGIECVRTNIIVRTPKEEFSIAKQVNDLL